MLKYNGQRSQKKKKKKKLQRGAIIKNNFSA